MSVERLIIKHSNDMIFASMLDAGANYGFHTRAMMKNEKIRQVIAIEANPSCSQKIKNYESRFDNLTVIEKALVAEGVKEVTFKTSQMYHGRGCIKELNIWSHYDPYIEWQEITVDVISLDRLLSHELDNELDYMKMGIEGAEVSILTSSCGFWETCSIAVIEHTEIGVGLAGLDGR